MFCKKGALRNFVKFTGKHVCQGLFFIKLQASSLKPSTLLEKRLWHRCFLVNFTKLLRTPFYTEHLWWLLPSDFSLSRIQIYFNLLFKKTSRQTSEIKSFEKIKLKIKIKFLSVINH